MKPCFGSSYFLDISRKDTNDLKIIRSSMLRRNIIEMIELAGSGHIGTSLSVVEILLAIKYAYLGDKARFFSSKGHDAPAIYSLMIAFGELEESFHGKLRDINGLPGHPDIKTKGITFNTGSLGMGISKGKGLLFGEEIKGTEKLDLITILGDGELQEGQIWESMAKINNHSCGNLLAIVDHNQIQSDTWVEDTRSLGDLNSRCASYGWNYIEVERGNDVESVESAINEARKIDVPTMIVAHTTKAKGIEQAERKIGLDKFELYEYHSGALGEEDYTKALSSLNKLIPNGNQILGNIDELKKRWSIRNQLSNVKKYSILETYSFALAAAAETDQNIVCLDADLVKDTGNYKFKKQHPSRHVEFGIAEQDMCSTACGLAAAGLYPWIHSFSCFLTTRAQEQIFNFSTEKRPGVFVGCLSGITPSAPGHSHQMTRDLPLMSTIPHCKSVEPVTSKQTKEIVDKMGSQLGIYYLRIANCSYIDYGDEFAINLPESEGDLTVYKNVKGSNSALVITSAEIWNQVSAALVRNRDNKLITSLYIAIYHNIVSDKVIDDLFGKDLTICLNSCYEGSFASNYLKKAMLLQKLPKSVSLRSVDDIPPCGGNDDVLKNYALDSESLENLMY